MHVLRTIRILVTYLKIIATQIGHSCGLVEGVFREEKCLKRWHFLRPHQYNASETKNGVKSATRSTFVSLKLTEQEHFYVL